MAYVNVAEWKPEQVTEWLKGLDNAVLAYVHSFLNNEVSGQQLLNLRPDDLDHLGVTKLGHQELILEAVEHLRNFHYELDRENLQLLALRLSCRARSLYRELLQHSDSRPVSTQTLADVANIITAVKPIACWLDRSPFTGHPDYQRRKLALLALSLEIATCAQRDRFAERPVEEIRNGCEELARLADSIIRDIGDPLVLQPASLDLATLKKKAGDDLGFFILPSFHGVHQIEEIKFSSPAHQCGKIEEGDEVVQVNYQTVVGWQTKKVLFLLEEQATDVFLTLKKRPRHTKVFGQIYMKPYRLPSRKRAAPYTRWHDNLPSPRPELLTIPDFEMPLPRASPKPPPAALPLQCEPLVGSSSSDEDDDEAFLPSSADLGHASPTSMRLYLPKQRSAVQRRATVTGASPTNRRPPVYIEQLWRELRQERQWREAGDDTCELRDKSPSPGPGTLPRPSTCLGIERPILATSRSSKSSPTQRITEEQPLPKDVTLLKERGRLDKSHSTPAYDLSDCPSEHSVGGTGLYQEESEEPCKDTSDDVSQPLLEDGKIPFCEKDENMQDMVHFTDCGKTQDVLQDSEERNTDSAVQLKEDRNEIQSTSKVQENSDTLDNFHVLTNTGSLDNSQVTKDNMQDSLQISEVRGRSQETLEVSEQSLMDGIASYRQSQVTDDVLSTPDSLQVGPDLPVIEDRETQRIGQLLDTINTALLQHRLREQESRACPPAPTFDETRPPDCMEVAVPKESVVSSNDSGSPSETLQAAEGPSLFRQVPPKVRMQCVPEDNTKPVPHPRGHVPDVMATVCAVAGLPQTHQSPVESLSAPEPPPRPDQPKVSYRARMVARTQGRAAVTPPSPRTLRKRNALLARKRQVSAPELGVGDCQGWLLHRCRSGTGIGATWRHAWFVLKGPALYGFKGPHAPRADVMIALPGFTAALADEVKSQKFAFKVYHTGTVFYFAAETEQELGSWLDSVGLVTLLQDPAQPDTVVFSETDEDSSPETETEPETETCFPGPKGRKLATLLGAGGPPSTSRSHQNLAADAKSQDVQKKFGSLKKLGRWSDKSEPGSPSHCDSPGAAGTGAASLDRKYLRFLGGRTSNVPVPTAQFRSYRRVPPQGKDVPQRNRQTAAVCSRGLVSKKAALALAPVQAHASNPSLQLPADMADYRLAAERLREFGGRRNRRREDTSGFVTLKAFMLSRQEEERRSSTNRGTVTSIENSENNLVAAAVPEAGTVQRGSKTRTRRGSFTAARSRPHEYRGGSPEKLWIDSLRRDDIGRRPVVHRPAPPTTTTSAPTPNLKSAAQYQPPPAPPPMRPAFEMHLGERTSRLRSFFSASPRLQRAIFRPRAEALPLPEPTSPDWNEPSTQAKPTMGISMLGKKPGRRAPPPPPSPPFLTTPDYPGLEYPPVFEPETYTLSGSSLLRSRQSRAHSGK